MNVNKALWETFDISILEREYSPSSCVPNYEELVARYTSESEIIEDQINITKDLNKNVFIKFRKQIRQKRKGVSACKF